MRHRGLALRGLLPAPLPNPGVVAREQHVGDAHAAIFGRPRELRAAGQLSAERVLLQGLRVADHAGDQAADRVDEHHRRDLAAAQDVVADRDLVRGQARADLVVDALVAAADDDQPRLAGELRGQALVQAPAPRLQEHDRTGVVSITLSTASNTGSGFITMPGPPPNGTSSTWRCRSWVKSRRPCVCTSMTPRSTARPTTPWRKTAPNMSGKIVMTSNLMPLLPAP